MSARTNPPLQPILIGARDAAKLLAISERTLWGLTAPRGPIPAARIGGAVRYRPADLADYVASVVVEGRANDK